LHAHLDRHLGSHYLCSEYLSTDLKSGEVVDGVLHVDLQQTHFGDDSLDYILSSDVLEHVPDPLQAMREAYRILRRGGCHIFTVPFYFHRFTNERRSELTEEGEIVSFRKEWYHRDPLRTEGVLVYNVFAPELLCELEIIGFEAKLCLVRSYFHGMLGGNGIVIVAKKTGNPVRSRDWIFPNRSK